MGSAEWRPVEGWEGIYDVSSAGFVRRVATGKLLRPMVTGHKVKSGQRATVRLCNSGYEDRQVAHIVLTAFVGPRPEGYVAMHLNDNPMDNTATNLRWATMLENAQDSSKKRRGGRQKLTVHQMIEVMQRRTAGEAGAALAKEFGVSQQRICDCYKRSGPKWSQLI